ncbi:MAG: T9SS type A sorting domain-containing protein, partial [Winogradskyella sp.]
MKLNYILSLTILFSISISSAQEIIVIDNSSPESQTATCTLPITNYSSDTYIPMRESVKTRIENRIMPCATINVNYINFPTNVINPSLPGPEQAAFQVAVDIWSNLIDSPVPITINANWTNLGASTLGSASAEFFAEIPGGGTNTLYPAALAEKIIGAEINGPNSVDITCNFNSQFSNWFFGDGVNDENDIASNEFDFISVVLHELGHGLGVAGFGIRIGNGSTSPFQGNIRRDVTGDFLPPNAQYFSIWDTYIDAPSIFGLPQTILDENNYPDPSDVMLAAFTGNGLTCNSPIAVAQNGGIAPKTFAPTNFNPGSSYSHWDESTFNGTPNALMTPQFGQGEVIQDPGNITLGFMEDMGWTLCQGSLSTNDFALENIKVSPNPFTNSITIELPPQIANQEFNIRIVDINGRIMNTTDSEIRSGEITISNLSNLKNALYF